MKNRLFNGLLISLLFLSLSVGSQTNLNINIGPSIVSEPVDVIMIPQTQVYYSPDSFDLFFFNGFWWAPRGNHWYRSRSYSGPWGIVGHKSVPESLRRIPKNYREISRRENHINYKQFKSFERHGSLDKHKR